MLYMQSQDCRIGICSRSDIVAQDIMTPLSRWKTISHDSLVDATLSDIAQTFVALGRHHIIVVESLPEQNTAVVRGLFSLTDLERTIGSSILINETAQNFSDINRALNS
jgi:hypothetical protein